MQNLFGKGFVALTMHGDHRPQEVDNRDITLRVTLLRAASEPESLVLATSGQWVDFVCEYEIDEDGRIVMEQSYAGKHWLGIPQSSQVTFSYVFGFDLRQKVQGRPKTSMRLSPQVWDLFLRKHCVRLDGGDPRLHSFPARGQAVLAHFAERLGITSSRTITH